MKSVLIFCSLLLFSFYSYSQTVSGRIVSQYTVGIPNLHVNLYVNPNVYTAITQADGSFQFTGISGIRNNELPNGYNISNNYPNPFNPRTRVDITLPKASNVKVEMFSITGQRVGEVIEKFYEAGTSHLDLELHGYANGVYFVRFNIDNQYMVTKKLMLIYGSQHLNTTTGSTIQLLNKESIVTTLDSIVVTGENITTQSFISLPQLSGSSLNVGNLAITTTPVPCPGFPTVTYEGKTYNTVQIGNLCWLKENLNVGTRINGAEVPGNNGIIEKYCYNNDELNCDQYGGLYTWDEVVQYQNTQQPQGICPPGWYVPGITEIEALMQWGNNSGFPLLEVGQGNGTNTTGFSALLAGMQYYGNFSLLGSFSAFNFQNPNNTPYFLLVTISGHLSLLDPSSEIRSGSLRCVRFDTSTVPLIPILEKPLKSDNGLPSSTELKWKESAGATSYSVQVSVDSQFTSYITNQNGLSANKLQLDELEYNKSYYWRVSAERGDKTSGWSEVWSFKTVLPCPGIPTVTYEGKVYNTVQIGHQCWLKENLNVGVTSQFQSNNGIIEKHCHQDLESNCDLFGGLYYFQEAIQYNNTQIKGICPEGWHIPTLPEFQVLKLLVNEDGNSLKAVGQGAGLGTGTNLSGFSALLAGYEIDTSIQSGKNSFMFSFNDHSFLRLNKESSSIDLVTIMYYNIKQSVRCIKGTEPLQNTTVTAPVGGESWEKGSVQSITWMSNQVNNVKIEYSTNNGYEWITIVESVPAITGSYSWTVPNTPSNLCRIKISDADFPSITSINNFAFAIIPDTSNACSGITTVDYEGRIYHTVQIAGQCWLKENLDVGVKIEGNETPTNNGIIEKYCYNDLDSLCNIYGGLYKWDEAMQYQTVAGSQGICPPGWHLPTHAEFTSLKNLLNNYGALLFAIGQGNGNNASGFTALLAGNKNNTNYGGLGENTLFWSSSPYFMNPSMNAIRLIYTDPSLVSALGSSVRCIKD